VQPGACHAQSRRELEGAENERYRGGEHVDVDAGAMRFESCAHVRVNARAQRQETVDTDGVPRHAERQDDKQSEAGETHDVQGKRWSEVGGAYRQIVCRGYRAGDVVRGPSAPGWGHSPDRSPYMSVSYAAPLATHRLRRVPP